MSTFTTITATIANLDGSLLTGTLRVNLPLQVQTTDGKIVPAQTFEFTVTNGVPQSCTLPATDSTNPANVAMGFVAIDSMGRTHRLGDAIIPTSASAVNLDTLLPVGVVNGVLFKPGMNPRGPWSSTASYTPPDVVEYNGNAYTCIAANSNQEPDTQTTYWQSLVLTGRAALKAAYTSGTAQATVSTTATDAFVTGTTIQITSGANRITAVLNTVAANALTFTPMGAIGDAASGTVFPIGSAVIQSAAPGATPLTTSTASFTLPASGSVAIPVVSGSTQAFAAGVTVFYNDGTHSGYATVNSVAPNSLTVTPYYYAGDSPATTAIASGASVSVVGARGATGPAASNPMTTLGDLIYGGTGGAPARLVGNTSATKQFLTETGTGTAAQAPSWTGLTSGDVTGALTYTPENPANKNQASGYVGLDANSNIIGSGAKITNLPLAPQGVNAVQSAYMDSTTNGKTAFLIGGKYVEPLMTSDTAPSPYVASASSEYDANHGAWDAFNGAATSGWQTASVTTGWLKLDLGAANAIALTGYSILSTATSGAQPKAWTFEGSNTGAFSGEQTTLDTQTNQTTWTGTNFYAVTNSTVYRYYRLNITANNGNASYLNIGHWGLYASNGASSTSAIDLSTNAGANPLVLSFANGLNSNGTFAHIPAEITANQNAYWSGLTSNATNYLFVSRNTSTGALSATVGAYQQVRTTVAPASPVSGMRYIDPVKNVAYAYTTSWQAEQCVPVGECAVDSTGRVTNSIAYSPQRWYRSGRVSCSASTAYTVNHNIGDDQILPAVAQAQTAGGALVPITPTQWDRNTITFTTPSGAVQYQVTVRGD